MVTPEEREQLQKALESRLITAESDGAGKLQLHEIFETYWPEWELLEAWPIEKQLGLKLEFLKLCVNFIPDYVVVKDEAAELNVPYHRKHLRDIGRIEGKISGLSALLAVQELDKFMWSMRLKGEGLGVL